MRMACSICLWWVGVCFTGPATLHGAGVIYYNELGSPTAPTLLRRINADATGSTPVSLNLPSALNPAVSRDGSRLLVTSPDPGRPFKMSRNVYVVDLATGDVQRATSYEDEVVLGGVRFTNDLARLFGDSTVSSYKIHFPDHKAFSPDRTRVVVMNLFKSGSITLGTPLGANDIQASSGRLPLVDVYNLADALPAGPFVFLSAQERTGLNQGGDGVDWHPTLEEVVATVAADVPVVGTAGRTSMEGTVLAVFSTQAISPFIRKLTQPVGEANAFIDLTTLIYTSVGPHDYAPSISPDGTQVAYVRHLLRQDTRFDGVGIAPLPAVCALRVIQYDGTGDREILRIAEGLWVTKLAWSPDGKQLAFDLAPQQVLNGWNTLGGDLTQSAIYVVHADGSQPRLLAAAPATYPTWAPALPAIPPVLRVRSDGNQWELRLERLSPGRELVLERSTALPIWAPWESFVPTTDTHIRTITPHDSAPFTLYRIRVP